MQTVELLLDPTTDAAMRADWQRLAEAGLPSQALHHGGTNAPHITLGVAETIPEEVEGQLSLAADVLPLPLQLGALVVFGSRRLVLARLVLPDTRLLELHEATASALQRWVSPRENAFAGHWTPHVTLARGVSRARIGDAITALGPLRGLSGQITLARRWDSERRRAWVIGSVASQTWAPAQPET